MVGRRFLAWLNDSRKGLVEGTDPTGPTDSPRPQSQPPAKSSQPIPPTLQRRRSDGKHGGWSFSVDLFSQLICA